MANAKRRARARENYICPDRSVLPQSGQFESLRLDEVGSESTQPTDPGRAPSSMKGRSHALLFRRQSACRPQRISGRALDGELDATTNPERLGDRAAMSALRAAHSLARLVEPPHRRRAPLREGLTHADIRRRLQPSQQRLRERTEHAPPRVRAAVAAFPKWGSEPVRWGMARRADARAVLRSAGNFCLSPRASGFAFG